MFDYNGGSSYIEILRNGGIVSYSRGPFSDFYGVRMGTSLFVITKLRIGTTTSQTNVYNWRASFTVKVYTFNLEG